jgi:hypothetical protein
MNPWLALVAYLAVGAGLASFVYLRQRRLFSAAVTLPLWPLWMPFAFARDEEPVPTHPLERRIFRALGAIRLSAGESAFESIIDISTIDAIRARAQKACAALLALDAGLERLRAEGRNFESVSARRDQLHRSLVSLADLAERLELEIALGSAGSPHDVDALCRELSCVLEAGAETASV